MNTLARNWSSDGGFGEGLQAKAPAGRLHWFHWCIVGASLLLTIGAWYVVQKQVDERIENQFERESDQIVELIAERMQRYEDALWGGVAAVRSQSQGIDYLEWKRFSDALQIEKKYPGINGIGVIFHKRPGEIAAFLAKEREARPDFRIHPPHDQKEIFPITYIEPADVNAAALGLDIAHENNRYMAAKKARDTGIAQITGPITLVQDAARTPGFLFYAPFYKGGVYDSVAERQKHFVGLVYAPFIFKNLMEGLLASDRRRVGIKITDGKEVLYDENHAGKDDFDPKPLFSRTVSVEEFGRIWSFEILSKKSFNQGTSNNRPSLILIGGLIIDSLLLWLFIVLTRSNRRATLLAQKMTGEYQSEALLRRSIVANTIDGLITIDHGGLIETFNPACEKLFGYKSDEVIGQNIKILMPEPYHAEHDGYLNNYHATGEKRVIGLGREVEGRKKDGTVFPLDLSVSETRAEGRSYYSGIIRDITERKKAETEIKQANFDLKRSNEELEQFAYLASHDLQEPLRGIASFCELLQARYADKLDDDGREFIGYAVDGAHRMRSLIDDLLTYSRVGRSEIAQAPVQLTSIIDDVRQRLATAIEETGAIITSRDLPVVAGDVSLLSQLFQNLIGNAIKFHGDNAPTIDITAQRQDGRWLITISDNGIGIEQKHAERVFQMFQRLQGREKFAGNGLGLALCKRVVERHGGEIWVEPTDAAGTTIKFTLPI